MAIYLDHTIVPAHDKEKSARFMAHIMGLEYNGFFGHFAPVKVNEHLSLDFDNRENFQSNHYAFLVTDEDFDAILGRVQEAGLKYGSGPRSQDDMQINHRHHGHRLLLPRREWPQLGVHHPHLHQGRDARRHRPASGGIGEAERIGRTQALVAPPVQQRLSPSAPR